MQVPVCQTQAAAPSEFQHAVPWQTLEHRSGVPFPRRGDVAHAPRYAAEYSFLYNSPDLRIICGSYGLRYQLFGSFGPDDTPYTLVVVPAQSTPPLHSYTTVYTH